MAQLFQKMYRWFHDKLYPKASDKEVKHKRLTLRPNDFLNNEVVFYFESETQPLVNKYLHTHFKRINKALVKKGMSFVYIPMLKKKPAEFDRVNLTTFLKYKHPELFIKNSEDITDLINSFFDNTEFSAYYRQIGEVLGVSSDYSPCLIHSIDIQTENTSERKWQYSVFSLCTDNKNKLHRQINHYLEKARVPEAKDIYFSLDNNRLFNYDADEYFSVDGNKVGDEILQALNSLKRTSSEKVILSSLVYLIKNLKDSHPDICERLNDALYKEIKNVKVEISRIVINEQFRIWLPDYGNTEIEMTPLPKAFYLFMLKHPKGIRFKDLSDHRDELIEIYKKVSVRTDMDQIKKSISDLTDIRSNSVNEKCSRIKEAFLLKFDDFIAQNYYITGGRNEHKSVRLNPALLQVPKGF